VAANGLKNLFTANEINGVLKALKNNGWVTDKEIKASNRADNKKKLKDYSEKIMNQRSGKMPPDEFNTEKG
jgi:hypothetical protein